MPYEYYSLLSVERSASAEEIKKAYRKKAMEHHPDRHAGDKSKEAEFKKINEAYATLSDTQKKAHYDQSGSAEWTGWGFGWFHWGFDVDLWDIFESFFGWNSSRKRAEIGEDIEIRVKISLEDAIRGTTRIIEFKRKSSCSSCSGNGAKNGSEIKTCEECHGNGRIRQKMQTVFGIMEQTVSCPRCSGIGKIITEKCHTCNGRWWEEKGIKKDIDVPAGIENGMSIKIRSEWHTGRDGNGDLYITFEVPDREAGFIREWDDLHYEVALSPAEATLGTEKTIEIPVLGKKSLHIKHGTQHNTEVVFKHEGLYSLQRKWYRGNLIIHLVIDISRKLSEDQKKLYEGLLYTEWGKKLKKWWLDSLFD